MFEDSTFESTGRIKTRSKRWMVATLAVNGLVLVALILIPLIYPDALPHSAMPFLMVAPAAPTVTKVEPVRPVTRPASDRPEFDGRTLTAPPRIPIGIFKPKEHEEPFGTSSVAMDAGSAIPGATENPFGAHPPVTVVHRDAPGPVRLSSMVTAGMAIYKPVPLYPPIAKATGVQGTVVLQAVISKSGTIENLHVVSGHQLLQQAAMDTVRSWRYRPFMLNGNPVEVETTVNVVFSISR